MYNDPKYGAPMNTQPIGYGNSPTSYQNYPPNPNFTANNNYTYNTNLNQMSPFHLMNVSPNTFYFNGTAMSLVARLEALNSDDLARINDANITVTGNQIRPINTCSLFCTICWGSLVIFPLCFMCCDWWQKCTYPAFEIRSDVYNALGKLLSSPNLRNLTLGVVDNCFDGVKANILYELVSRSNLSGFTLINGAGGYDYNNDEYSKFIEHMMPIKQLSKVSCDLRWYTKIVL